MGHLAEGVIRHQGTVVGILPSSLSQLAFAQLSQSEITEDIYSRQQSFERLSDAFVALPGGVGTLAELFCSLNTKLLGAHKKPIIVLNAQHAYDPFLLLLDSMIRAGFVQPAVREAFSVVRNVSSVLRLIDEASLAHAEGLTQGRQDSPAPADFHQTP